MKLLGILFGTMITLTCTGAMLLLFGNALGLMFIIPGGVYVCIK